MICNINEQWFQKDEKKRRENNESSVNIFCPLMHMLFAWNGYVDWFNPKIKKQSQPYNKYCIEDFLYNMDENNLCESLNLIKGAMSKSIGIWNELVVALELPVAIPKLDEHDPAKIVAESFDEEKVKKVFEICSEKVGKEIAAFMTYYVFDGVAFFISEEHFLEDIITNMNNEYMGRMGLLGAGSHDGWFKSEDHNSIIEVMQKNGWSDPLPLLQRAREVCGDKLQKLSEELQHGQAYINTGEYKIGSNYTLRVNGK